MMYVVVATAAFVIGFGLALLLPTSAASVQGQHEHTWGPWEEAHQVEARSSFDVSVALVQIRSCLDDECKESETKTLQLVSSRS